MPVVPDTPLPSDVLKRLDVVARHLAYLDRRFDDTNHRLKLTERNVVSLLDDVGAHVDTALTRSTRHHVAALVCAQLGQLAVLVAVVAGVGPWP